MHMIYNASSSNIKLLSTVSPLSEWLKFLKYFQRLTTFLLRKINTLNQANKSHFTMGNTDTLLCFGIFKSGKDITMHVRKHVRSTCFRIARKILDMFPHYS